jgi:hypothetical protein
MPGVIFFHFFVNFFHFFINFLYFFYKKSEKKENHAILKFLKTKNELLRIIFFFHFQILLSLLKKYF